MKIRTARYTDINQIQRVKNSVTENSLSDPNFITNRANHKLSDFKI